MSKRNRAAAKAAGIRKAKKAREHRREDGGLSDRLDRIAGYLAERGCAVNVLAHDAARALGLPFRLHVASRAGDAEVRSRDVEIRVWIDDDEGCIRVVIPCAWNLEGVPDQYRARFFENVLDAVRILPVGMRVHFGKGGCGVGVHIRLSEDQLPEKVFEAMTHLLQYIAFIESPVQRTLENGHWVEPELVDVGHEDLTRQTQEVVDRVEEERKERLVAILGRACLALRQIKEHEDGESDGGFDPAMDITNAAFVVQGRVTQMCLLMDQDALERSVEPLEARAHELSAGHVTTS